MAIAVTRKTATATKDLMLSLAIPQRPCPLVHPFPSLVPKPTSRPAKAYPKYDVAETIWLEGPKGVKELLVS